MDRVEVEKRFAALLEDERVAIRRLDSAAVEHLNDQKLALAEALRAVSVAGDAESVACLKRVSALLRRNAILLAHAREATSGAIEVLRSAANGPRTSWTG
jgi:hypothetical protein